MKAARRTIFTTAADIEALALAKCGWSNHAIQRETGIDSLGKITYRLKQAALKEELPKGMGYRKMWASGKSKESKDYARQTVPGLKEEIREQLVPQFFHPTPRVASSKVRVAKGDGHRRFG